MSSQSCYNCARRDTSLDSVQRGIPLGEGEEGATLDLVTIAAKKVTCPATALLEVVVEVATAAVAQVVVVAAVPATTAARKGTCPAIALVTLRACRTTASSAARLESTSAIRNAQPAESLARLGAVLERQPPNPTTTLWF